MVRKLAAAGLAACALLAARPAAAFLVVGTDAAQAPGPRTRVIVLREEGRSVIAVAPTVRGPAKPLAIVLPIPRAAASSLRAAPITVFERTDALAAPRADELWELDPCELHPDHQSAPASPSASASPANAPDAALRTEGDYEITVLGEHDSQDVAKWLLDHGYRLSDAAAGALDAARAPGTAFAVARIDGGRLTFEKEIARLPPLAFVVDGAPDLPLSLAGLGAAAAHDTIVDVLAPHARFEAANLVNVAAPTNLDVIEDARSDLDGLHRAVIDFTFERLPGAAITEYAWLAASCDGCEGGKGLDAADLLALGAGELPSAEDGSQREVMVDVTESLARAPEGPPELKRAIAACYGRTLAEMRGLEGAATITVQTGDGGAVASTKIESASAEALGKCVEEAARAMRLDHANARGTIGARFALVSRAYLGAMVLSRLRVRGTKGASSALKLRAAAAIEGGREEGPAGEAEKRVYFAEHANNFRERYVVRHPWAGPITCEEPKRGVWGQRPRNAPPGRPAAPAASPSAPASAGPSGKPAAPTEAEQRLAAFLVGGALPDLAAYAITFRAAPPTPAPAPSASGPPATSAAPPAASSGAGPGTGGGCGCRAATGRAGAPTWIAISAITALAARLRRRQK